MATADCDTKIQVQQEIEKHNKRKTNYKQLEKQLQETGETQVSTSDPESRQMIIRNNITEVAYNIQTSVDAKYCLPFDYKVTNTNDSKAMGNMLQRSKTILRSNEFTALYDKGYHTGTEFKIADTIDIDILVAIPTVAANAPDPAYNVEHFKYDDQGDFYTCPQGNKLTSTGKWHQAKTYKFKRYTTKDCLRCPVKDQCSKAKYGKAVQRSQYQQYINKNKERIAQNKNCYRKRQAIVEHPYGTIKRQWGFSYIMTKKYIERAEADVGFIFIAYNLRRIINIIGQNSLQKYLKEVISFIVGIIHMIKLKISYFKLLYLPLNFSQLIYVSTLK